jgi:cytochrome c oxidase cbb3-type subunit 4
MVIVMDINDIRAWQTAILLISFIGIIFWAYSKRRKSAFDEAANLPFADEKRHQATIEKENLS